MSKKLQITIVISTIAVILLLIGLFSLRQMHGTELPMDEDDSLALLEKLEGQGIFDADKYIFSDTVKDESSKRTSVIVHSTDYSDKTEGEFDAEAIKAMVVSFGKTFLSEVVEKKTFENLNATEVFSFSGGDKRIQFDFSEPIPTDFGIGDAYGCASIVFDKNEVLQSVTLYFNKDDGDRVLTVIFGNVPLEAVISTGGEVVFVPIEE